MDKVQKPSNSISVNTHEKPRDIRVLLQRNEEVRHWLYTQEHKEHKDIKKKWLREKAERKDKN
jgi:hypothetical protein